MNRTFMMLIAGAGLMLAMAACGGGGNNNQQVQGPAYAGQACVNQPGFVFTQQYGCLPQANCPMGQALYNNQQCVPASYNQANNCPVGQAYTAQGCLPQGPCPVGQGWSQMQNTCIPGMQNGMPYGQQYPGYGNGYNQYPGYGNGYNQYPGYNTGYGYGNGYPQNPYGYMYFRW
jgi:hypothetical protein